MRYFLRNSSLQMRGRFVSWQSNCYVLKSFSTNSEALLSSRQYHHGQLKSALIEAGKHLIKEDGVEALSLRGLAQFVGVSHMAPYAHFKNKAYLLLGICISGFEDLAARLESVSADLAPEQRILEYGTQYLAFALENPKLYRLMLSQSLQPASTDDDDPDALSQAGQRPFNILREAFAELTPDDQEQTIRAQGAWSMVHGMAALLIEGRLVLPEGMSLKEFLARASVQSHIA